jgi:hypothetical protein
MASVTLSKPGKGAELSRADAEAGRTARLCGVQIVGALAHSGVLDLGGETPVIRYVPETKTKTEKITETKTETPTNRNRRASR